MSKERSVLASFHSEPEANKAREQIERLGVSATQVAHFSAYGRPDNDDTIRPISGDIPSIANLALDTNVSSRDAGILLGADPAASGMSDGGGRITGRDWLLTVVCADQQVEQVVQIIKSCNGYT